MPRALFTCSGGLRQDRSPLEDAEGWPRGRLPVPRYLGRGSSTAHRGRPRQGTATMSLNAPPSVPFGRVIPRTVLARLSRLSRVKILETAVGLR